MSLFTRFPIPTLAAIFVTGTIFPLSHPARAQETPPRTAPPAQAAPAQEKPVAGDPRKATGDDFLCLLRALDNLAHGRTEATLRFQVESDNLKVTVPATIVIDAVDAKRFRTTATLTRPDGVKKRFEVVSDGKQVTVRDLGAKTYTLAPVDKFESGDQFLLISMSLGFTMSSLGSLPPNYQSDLADALKTEIGRKEILSALADKFENGLQMATEEFDGKPARALFIPADDKTRIRILLGASADTLVGLTLDGKDDGNILTMRETIRSLGPTTVTAATLSVAPPKGFKKVNSIDPMEMR